MSENNRHRRVASQMAERYGVDPELFGRLVTRESGWDPNAKGKAGEIGYTQVMAETALDPGFGVTPLKDRSDPVDNLRFGAEYLGKLIDYYDGDYSKALMAYNGGAGNVDKGSPSAAAQRYANELLGGKQVKDSKSSDLGSSESSDNPPMAKISGSELARGIAALTGGKGGFSASSYKGGSSPTTRFGSSSRMSPLSGSGIPGLDSIKQYSTPGGVESLYRKSVK